MEGSQPEASRESPGRILPEHRSLYYGGGWHSPLDGSSAETFDPGRGIALGRVAEAGKADIDRAVAAAKAGFLIWRDVAPLERARILKEVARLLRTNARDLAMIDAANCGNPVTEMIGDACPSSEHLALMAA